MRVELREHYTRVVNFLGLALGPNYEIALHDLNMGDETVIAIANGRVTNRKLGAPITNFMLENIEKEKYDINDHEVNYNALSMENKSLRSSTLYIKDAGKLVGLLCITFDDSQYRELGRAIMGLCHPENMLESTFEQIEYLKTDENSEIFGRDIKEVFESTLASIQKDNKIPLDRLKKGEKLDIVEALKDRGIFLLKGAIPEVAKLLHSSEATIYRYITQIEIKKLKEQ